MIQFLKTIINKLFYIKIWKSTFIDHSDNLEISIENNLVDEISDKFIYVADPFTINNRIYFEGLSLFFKKGQLFSLLNNQISKIKFSKFYKNKHMSFPYVFNKKDITFLLPQISNFNKLVLFKLNQNIATEYKTLLLNNEYRDSIIFNYDNNYIVFTSEKNKLKSDFKAYLFNNNFDFISEYDLVNYDKKFRCAGSVFINNDEYILPIQKSKPIYGSGVILYKFQINQNQINFTLLKEITLQNSENKITGFHTYNFINDKKVLIDFRIEKFKLFAIFYKLKFYYDQVS
jgi:hypothetical protein